MFEIKENLEEYQFDPSSHSPNVKILNLIKSGKKVLDVGCASGYLAARLVKKKCQVFGIEIDKKAAQKASKHCQKVINDDVELIDKLPFPQNFFDIVVLSDILEHLKRPDLVLIKLKKYLADDGVIIASIPNVARIEIRLKLALGRFDYQESGILKRDHLRFFTLSSAKKMFQEAGFKITKIEPTGLGSRVRIFPTLFAFQFIIVAQI
ncbi:class I SAM-dependent methyltransferase [Patescibacteria group bacterium]|nr:class I SAM-dependent methyltransferase [Patescibacteria group bacterium]